jgi:hypothetical protein
MQTPNLSLKKNGSLTSSSRTTIRRCTKPLSVRFFCALSFEGVVGGGAGTKLQGWAWSGGLRWRGEICPSGGGCRILSVERPFGPWTFRFSCRSFFSPGPTAIKMTFNLFFSFHHEARNIQGIDNQIDS